MTFQEKKEFINQAWTQKTFDKGEEKERTITIFNDENIEPIYGDQKGTEEQKTWRKFKNICYEKEMKIDDYWFTWLSDAFEEIKVTISDCKNEEEAIEAIENAEYEPEADIYTHDLTKWLHSRVDRVYYLSDAMQSGFGDTNDGFQLLTGAQWTEMNEVYEVAKEIVKEFLLN